MILDRFMRILELLKTDGALKALLLWPKFSLAAFTLVSRMKKAGVDPATVIDVGANIGQFAIASVRLFENAAVFPIEPDARVARKLRSTLPPSIRENVLETAVGDIVGTALLHVNRDPQMSSLLPIGSDQAKSFPRSQVVGKVEVSITTLDALFANQSLPAPILLKIDVQGFEDRVIRGATAFLTAVDWVLMEVSFSALYEGNRDFDSIIALMASQGFRFVRPVDFHTSPTTEEITEMDALFESLNRRGRPS